MMMTMITIKFEYFMNWSIKPVEVHKIIDDITTKKR